MAFILFYFFLFVRVMGRHGRTKKNMVVQVLIRKITGKSFVMVMVRKWIKRSSVWNYLWSCIG